MKTHCASPADDLKVKQSFSPRFAALALPLASAFWLLASSSAHAQSPLPDDFDPTEGGSLSLYPGVYSMALQPDGKILLGGPFTKGIRRLNADGGLDTEFNPEANRGTYSMVYSMVLQPDGKIVIGGYFTILNGQSCKYVGRLNADGSLDSTFNPGVNETVVSVAVQADGKILLGGFFTTVGDQPLRYLARVNADGTVDRDFNPQANYFVLSMALQSDGKILVGGRFSELGGQSHRRIGRLNADGTPDQTFNPSAEGNDWFDYEVRSLVVQADGGILVGGYFDTLCGKTRKNLGRLKADGTLDSGFLNPNANWRVNSLALQANGKVLVGGHFDLLGGQTRTHIARLNPSGSLDTRFNPGANNPVVSLAVQADGKILVSGEFGTLGGQRRDYIGRLNNLEPATQSLSYDGSTITWLRGGASPEVWRTSFEVSTNGNDWTPIGQGSRIFGGWNLTSSPLPPDSIIRARGYATGGYGNASGWFVESYYGRPVFVAQPASRTNNAGTTATFNEAAGGSEPLSYQWFKDRLALAELGQTPALTLSNVLGGDSGGYHVVVSNAFGSVTSVVARLTVVDPLITAQPVKQTREPGQTVTFSAKAVGTMPLTYQWVKEGRLLASGSEPSLTLTNLQGKDAGDYRVVVTSPYGSATSQVARLIVNLASWDLAFTPEFAEFDPRFDSVDCLAAQVDGKILVGGSFASLVGQSREGLVRLSADGIRDRGFNPGANERVRSLAVQPDGKILVAGDFTMLRGRPCQYLGRLTADGALDVEFDPGANDGVASLAVQPDGKILVGGSFASLVGQSREGLVRLSADGIRDRGFNPGANGGDRLAVQPDGKILVGGGFTMLSGEPRKYLGRLNADGSLDGLFNPGPARGDSYTPFVSWLTVQPDGKILVAGDFTIIGGQACPSIARLTADGTIDQGFSPDPAYRWDSEAAVQADGKIVVVYEDNIVRLNADGTFDNNFELQVLTPDWWYDYLVSCVPVLQTDGKILVYGYFANYDFSEGVGYFARINNTDAATQSLTYDGSTITWLRGGSSPEIWRASFEWSTNGSDWTSIGEGVHISGGWLRTGVSLPLDASLRARGFVAQGGSTAWIVEAFWRAGPDLEIVEFEPPLQAVVGSVQSVLWTTANQGSKPVPSGWVDRVFLSEDDVPGNDRLVGEFSASGPLGTNQFVPNTASLTIPADLEPERNYWWIVVTDAANAVDEENEINNARVSDHPLQLLTAPLPNLRVASVSTSANPMSGQPMTITWAVTNAGSWSTGAGWWQDAVYLSADAALGADDLLLGRGQRSHPLGTNESYSISLSVTIPQGLSGAHYLIVRTDADNRVNEGVFENDNATASAPITVALTPPPDLQVAAIQSPVSASSGDTLAVSWSVTNAGPGLTAEMTWVDEVYLSPSAGLATNAVRLGSVTHDGALTNGQVYASSASFALPVSVSGTFYLVVHTDAGDNVFEQMFETNNVAASGQPIVITLSAPPDLAVERVDAPSTAVASHPLAIGYTVANRGADSLFAFFWQDALYLTTNAPPHPSPLVPGTEGVLYLGSATHFGGLAGGGNYTNVFAATLPDGLSGPFYAIVQTDAGEAVFELVKTNNLRGTTAPILVESRPADLIVTRLTAPASVQAGSSLLVSWAVRNQGSGDTAVSRWTDGLVLSADATLGNADDVLLLTLDHDGLLSAGGSYTVTNQVATVPFAVAPGTWRLFAVTDSGNRVHEGANDTNNASAPHTIAVTRTTADLRLAAVSLAPAGGEGPGQGGLDVYSEDPILVSWRVENIGAAAPNSSVWTDAVYLSTNSILDTNAVLLGFSQNPASLAPAAFYTNALEVTLPAEIAGDFFVHVVTDAGLEVVEDRRANNTLLATNTLEVTLRPVPDLAVLSVASPADGFSGQLFEMSWTVTNSGPATAEGTWYDSVYLSLDTQFEPDLDTYIGYAERPHTLTNGQSYTQTAVLEIPPEVSGLLRAFVVCDSTARLNERGSTANNVGLAPQPVGVWIHPPADLVVGTVTIPANTVAGYEMALTYVLHNQGTNAAFGPWVDALYLSADDQWDLGDALFARVSQAGSLAVGGNRTNTVNAPSPGLPPGDYRVIIRTDVVNQVPETAELNNITASLDQVAAQVEELTLSVPTSGQIANRQARYYRVAAPAGQWMILEMDCGASAAATELFIRHGAIPTRSEFDFLHSNPLEADHRIVVPDTRAGDYYILAFGDFIPAPGTTAFTLTARLSQSEVLATSFGRAGNAGTLTIPIDGANFDRSYTVRLRDASGLDRLALSHWYESSTRFYATLDLHGLAPGFYTVAVQNGTGPTVTIPNSLEVVAAPAVPPGVVPWVTAPRAVRDQAAYQFIVHWANTSLNDAPAPLLTVGNTAPFGLAPGDYSLGTRHTFLGINTQGGPAGILRSGQTEFMVFYTQAGVVGAHQSLTAFADRTLKDPTAAYDWESLRSQLAIGDLSAAEFDQAFAELMVQTGPTQGDFLAMLARNCSLLPPSLGDPSDPDAALLLDWNRALAATSGSISGRIVLPDTTVQFASVTFRAVNAASGESAFAPVLLDGCFSFPRLAPGVYELGATGALLDEGQPAVVNVPANEAVTNVILTAGRGGVVHGVVFDAATMRPVSDATVTLLGASNASAVTKSAADGSFRACPQSGCFFSKGSVTCSRSPNW